MINDSSKKHRGAALLLFVVLFMFVSLLLVFTLGRGAYQAFVQYRTAFDSAQAFYAGEAAIEDAAYRAMNALEYSVPESFVFAGSSITVVRTSFLGGLNFHIQSILRNAVRNGHLNLVLGSGASFSFGLQSDTGGIVMENSSSVLGNVYSN